MIGINARIKVNGRLNFEVAGEWLDICLAVLSDKVAVVVATSVDEEETVGWFMVDMNSSTFGKSWLSRNGEINFCPIILPQEYVKIKKVKRTNNWLGHFK